MARSRAAFTRAAITEAKVQSAQITVSENSTSTNIYKFIDPISEAAAVVAADAERVLFSRSFLGSVGKHLDNVLREINIARLDKESDESLRTNAPKIFSPGDTPATVFDQDAQEEVNQQLTDIEPQSVQQLFTKMKARFFRLQGASDLPMIMPRYWKAAAFRLHEMYTHIENIVANNITEDSEDIGDTDWHYKFDALRVPGVKDAKVEISDYNEIIIHVRLDERALYDSRGVKYFANESEILERIKNTASKHLPKPDHNSLKPPRLIVRKAQEKPLYVKATLTGAATKATVRQALDDYFYNNKKIGVLMEATDIVSAIRNTPGVTTFVMSSPSDFDLMPYSYEILSLGQIDLN